MRITLDVPEDVADSAEQMSRATGISRETLLADALRAYFPPMSDELRAEIDGWQAAADADAAKLGL